MNAQAILSELKNIKAFFDRTTSCFEEKDSGFAAAPGTYTVAQQIAHTALTVDWFLEGAFSGKGFDMNFAAHDAETRKVTTLSEARARWERSCANAARVFGSKSDAELAALMPQDGIMGNTPKYAIVHGIADHTAHHRGALAVYARLVGKVAPMPYA